jgi:hypothetical protein
VKGKEIALKFSEQYFIYDKTGYLAKYCRNRAKKNPKKRSAQHNIIGAHYLTNKISKTNLSNIIFKVNLINNSECFR